MSIPTVAVTCTAYDQNGNAVAGGTFRARLNSTEIYNGFVVPEQVTGVADASGVCVLQLWPNALGVAGSAYRITAINPDTGQKYLDTTAVVPNSACNLHQIIVAAPYPTLDASQQALVAAQGALAAVTAQAGIATTKAAEASASATTAATQAGVATTQAGTATTQAGIATTQATTATTQADIAAIQAGIATTKASEASASAATATTQAGTATTKASEAAASAATATTQAGTATTQAGVATTKASEAAASATNASNSAYTAGLSVDAAVTAKNQAVSSASAAASSATAASGSATAASTSASSASASASTATTQAGTATTQAGLATTAATTATSKASEASTYASNASASANTATTQAGVATTQAGIATTQAGVATTQAGIAIANANAALSVYGSVTAQQAAVTAAQNAATSATASATAANTSAGNASGSAASALAIYGTTAAQQAALTNAQSAASLAQGYALSASSAIQQDLSGVTAQALHRSPNAVTSMFVYDTSKDSDGGAWTEKCQHTSWYNEVLNGKWLGAHDTEFQARNAGATLGIELSDTISNAAEWTVYGANTLEQDGTAVKVTYVNQQGGAYSFFRATKGLNTDLVVGKSYRVSFSAKVNAGSVTAGVSTSTAVSYKTTVASVAYQTYSVVFVATSATGDFFSFDALSSGEAVWVKDISVREVTALTTASGDYYQSTVDGKFYRLWKNLLTFSEQFDNAYWAKIEATVSANQIAAPDGTFTADKILTTAVNSAHVVFKQSIVSSGVVTLSVYAKAGEYSWLFLSDTNSTINGANFNLATGVLGTVGSNATATIVPAGNGWYRCTVTTTASSGSGIGMYVQNANNTVSYAGNVNNGIYLWGAQLELGSTATAYEAKTVDGTITETFRGNKADFPRLAGIVAEASNVTIYDLTEAGRPMWMRFVGINGQNNMLNSGMSVGLASVFALQGRMGVAGSNASSGCVIVNFPADASVGYSNASQPRGRYRGDISQRQLNKNYDNADGFQTTNSSAAFAIAMTVLPDAPVDAVTGLQVPTIAVATAAGVSVIKHNGTVVNSSSTGAYNSIALTPYALHTNAPGGSNLWNIAAPLSTLGASFALSGTLTQGQFASPDQATVKTVVPSRSRLFRMESNTSRMKIGNLNETGAFKSSAVSLSNTFNTGHLIGDIRRAYLADTDVGNVSGLELVTNGTFDSDISGWSSYAGDTAPSWESGKLKVTATIGYGRTNQIFPLVIGKSYVLNITAQAGTGNPFAIAGSIVNGSDYFTSIGVIGSFTKVFVATTSSLCITVRTSGQNDGSTAYFDNISVKEVVADRSYKAQAASITGTLTKTQVAAASQLVAYSGFSASNYLREPYSADLDFGTGEWSCGAWVNVPVTLPVGSFPNVGSELQVNGTFDTDLTGWVKTSGVGEFSVVGGELYGNGTTGEARIASTTAITLTSGKWYRVACTARRVAGNRVRLFVGVDNNTNYQYGILDFTSTSNATQYLYVLGTGGSLFAKPYVESGTTGYYDNISVSEVSSALIADRAHSSGAKINLGVTATGLLTATAFDGTTTRTVTTTAAYNTGTMINPIVTYTTDGTLAIRVNGAEVAATRGTPLLSLNSRYNFANWSENLTSWATKINVALTAGQPALSAAGASSTLVVPSATSNRKTLFNQVYGPATGVPCIITFLVKPNGYSIVAVSDSQHNSIVGQVLIFNLSNLTITSFAGPTTGASITDLGGGVFLCRIAYTPSNITTYVALNICPVPASGVAHDYSGPTFAGDGVSGAFIGEIQVINGSVEKTYQRTTTVAETEVAPLTIGNSFAADAPFPGSISLLKLSATVPTSEQSQWMYEQEKQMFRDGAQVCLPDSGSIVDLTYDDATDKWIAVSAANESEWSGLVRTSVTASPAGSYTKVAAASGVQLQARSTTNPGVDINIPSYGLREELVNRSQAAARLARNMVAFDYVGGFTANTTTGSTAIASVASLTYPVSYVGARISGAGIPANTTVVAVSGTTIYMSAAATATASGVQISFVDFTLPVGYEAREVLTAGLAKVEGATKDFTRLFDGFKETIRFGTAPGYNAAVQIQATRSAS